MEELSQGTIRQGLWGQALAESDGDEDSARAKYLVVRVQSMMDEEEIRQFSKDELTEETQKKEREQAKADVKLKSDAAKASFWRTFLDVIWGSLLICFFLGCVGLATLLL